MATARQQHPERVHVRPMKEARRATTKRNKTKVRIKFRSRKSRGSGTHLVWPDRHRYRRRRVLLWHRMFRFDNKESLTGVSDLHRQRGAHAIDNDLDSLFRRHQEFELAKAYVERRALERAVLAFDDDDVDCTGERRRVDVSSDVVDGRDGLGHARPRWQVGAHVEGGSQFRRSQATSVQLMVN